MSPQFHHNHLHLLLLQYQVSASQKDEDLYGLLSLLAHNLLFVQVPNLYFFLRKALSSSNKHLFYENICQKLLDVYYIVPICHCMWTWIALLFLFFKNKNKIKYLVERICKHIQKEIFILPNENILTRKKLLYQKLSPCLFHEFIITTAEYNSVRWQDFYI